MNKFKSMPMKAVETNTKIGNYRARFFDLAQFHLSRVDMNSVYFNQADVERELLLGNFSFCYLREDKLRTIDAYDVNGRRIEFNEFLQRLGITIKSRNIFKSSKYISRCLRAVRYGSFFKGLDIYIKSNPTYSGKITDGISLLNIKVAHALGWTHAKAGQSAQLTVLNNYGMTKGNCVLSDKINHDVIIYGEDNIKNEITLNNNLQYISIEPLKLGKTLRLDIQSMLNLYNMLGTDQLLEWAHDSIEQFKADLFSGRINNWLDNFDEIEPGDYNKEQWTLRKAIYHKIDYTKYPGLIRAGWNMFRNSLVKMAEKKNGAPNFRIPVPSGKRGYLRVDLRNHDGDGNFFPTVEENEVELDSDGNLWVHPNNIEKMFTILGGADQDDSVGIIPVENNQAVIYRNPNQFSEWWISKIKFSNVEISKPNKLVGAIPQKEYKVLPTTSKNVNSNSNSLLNKFLQNHSIINEPIVEYSIASMLKTYTRISKNSSNIGRAANGEMLRSAVGIKNQKMFARLFKGFVWDLEKIIDATVKDGTDSSSDMAAIDAMIKYIIANKIELPKSITHRLPEKLFPDATISTKHPLDELLAAIKYLVDKADLDVLGRGAVSKGNRIKGRIDNILTPIVEIGIANLDNPMNDAAMFLLKDYNKQIAIMMERTESLESFEKECARKNSIDEKQTELLSKLINYSIDERSMIAKSWAYNIYKNEKAIHDSILWISDKEDLRGTASNTIKMLSEISLGCCIKSNGSIKRFYQPTQKITDVKQIRVWSKEKLRADTFISLTEIIVENKTVLLGDQLLNLGDDTNIKNGCYQIKEITPSLSRHNKSVLRNSLSVYLA